MAMADTQYNIKIMSDKEKIGVQMLGSKLPTDPRWVNLAEKDLEEILTDHAYCEQKGGDFLWVPYSTISGAQGNC